MATEMDVNWATVFKSARDEFRVGVNRWIDQAEIRGGIVHGPNAEITAGSFASAIDFRIDMVQCMTRDGIPREIAWRLAEELYSAWTEWAHGFHMRLTGAFPNLAAVPGRQAPPTPMGRKDFGLSEGLSAGEYRLRAATLTGRLTSALRSVVRPDDEQFRQSLGELADWVDQSFQEWKRLARFSGLLGSGPIPTYAPPYVPAGPVVGGHMSSGIGKLISGPRFGKHMR